MLGGAFFSAEQRNRVETVEAAILAGAWQEAGDLAGQGIDHQPGQFAIRYRRQVARRRPGRAGRVGMVMAEQRLAALAQGAERIEMGFGVDPKCLASPRGFEPRLPP